MTLRYLAGGHYLDIMHLHQVKSHASFYKIIWHVVDVLIMELDDLAEFPIDDPAKLKTLSDGFYELSGQVVRGCVGALDGIAFKIHKPIQDDSMNPMAYWNRKGFFAIVCQAIRDADARFRWFTATAQGSCRDSTAWQMTALAGALKVAGLRLGCWIAADDAYGNSDYLLCPYPGRRLDIPEDSFNYFQSKCRITIERAFGILVARWQICENRGSAR
ncbi:hypothetical protein CYMTET_16796 [Cymbomonas tetramitiformis]|nr:hypothetical protein CYMTET_16796 [Cymbomonas tetramitiformis]